MRGNGRIGRTGIQQEKKMKQMCSFTVNQKIPSKRNKGLYIYKNKSVLRFKKDQLDL